MRRSLGRFKSSGVLITICIGSFSICIQKILDLGQEVFVIRGTFIDRMRGLCMYKHTYTHVYIYIYT